MRDLWSAWQYLVEKSAQLLEGDCLFQYCGFSLNFKPDIYIPSKNKIIDAATSNYKDEHKLKQYKKGIQYVDAIEYWCLNKNNTPGYDFPNLKYIFADELIERLSALGQFKLCEDIKNLYSIYENFNDSYIAHRKEYIINKLKKFHKINGRAPFHRELSCNPEYPSSTTVCNVFGSLNNAIIAAGLEINRKGIPKFNEDIAKNDLLNFIKTHKRLPKYRELGFPNTTYTQKVYTKYWGSISNCAKTLNDDSIIEYLK